MADTAYKVDNFVFSSRGIVARPVDDTIIPGALLNEDNMEELAENAIGTRLGTAIVNRTSSTINQLSGGTVHSLAKLAGLNGAAWRYAGCGINFYRKTGLSAGAYTLFASLLSGNPWSFAVYRQEISSFPYIFIADANSMFKDNGLLSAPQQMGIFQPQYPVAPVAQIPTYIILDNYTGMSTDYTYTGISSGTIITYVNTTLSEPVGPSTPDPVNIAVADPKQTGLFQLLTINSGGGSQETILSILNYKFGFVGVLANHHIAGETVTNQALSVSIPASTTATIAKSFGGTPIASWPTTLKQADYIGFYLFTSDPSQIQTITIKFDCGDGSFNSDYFFKVIAQGPLQNLLNTSGTQAVTAAADSILSSSLGIYSNSSTGLVSLSTGLDVWSPLLLQLSDFAGAGRADFNDPVFNWNNVNGYQLTIVTNDQTSVTVNIASLILEGGAGPDVFAGVSYDYLFTFYNAVDGTESNPCVPAADQNINTLPLFKDIVNPRRQPVQLTMTHPTLDPQVTHVRVYRRGGTLGDNYRRVDTVACSGTSTVYTDISSDSDIQNADIVSFTNDVPVTSTLTVPVNTTLSVGLTAGIPWSVESVFPASMANISKFQQVIIGDPTSPVGNSEVVIVLTVASDHFTAAIQNTHSIGEPITATATYGQPVTIMTIAFDQNWLAGDPNNPNELYWSPKSNPQYFSSAAHVPVSTPDDPITVIVQFKGNLYVSTIKGWWAVAPGSNANASPTIYPTAAKHGCVAKNGFIVTEEAILYQAIDGVRAFAGGASEYLTQDIEFIFQNFGQSPIVEANINQLSQTRAAYWNNMHFFSYLGNDGNFHRAIYHSQYKRWRNDDIPATSLLLEADTNTLVWGDANGLVHLDRQFTATDEGNNAGTLILNPIAINLQTPYLNQSAGELQKNYVELQLDINTGGQNVTVTLLFNDGQSSLSLGTVNTSVRQKVNLPINSGNGQQAYKISLQITGNVSASIFAYQAAIRWLPLAMTRKSFDSYALKLGTDESKILKQIYLEITSTSTITFNVYYDSSATAGYTFTVPSTGGIRQSLRFRLPAISFRIVRFIATSTADWQLWTDSKLEFKPLCSGKGYSVIEFVPN